MKKSLITMMAALMGTAFAGEATTDNYQVSAPQDFKRLSGALHVGTGTAYTLHGYVVSRAVTAMPTFVKWIWGKIERGQKGSLANGILYLKGGDLTEELAATKMPWQEFPISEFFEEEFFETKKVVYTKK